MQFIDLGAQYKILEERISSRISKVLNHGQYIMGPEVSELETRLSKFVGVKHAITCANGTDALQLCLMSLGIGEGDVVFCPTFTFFATAEVISLSGATPIFVDSDSSFNICSIDLERRIEYVKSQNIGRVAAVISVDLFGLPADYTKLHDIAKKFNLKIIEDAAQGFGGEINGRRAGSFGDVATTSFFPAKPLGCYGDGGAIFTNDDALASLIRSLRVHGKGNTKYDNVRIGLNSRLDTIQAAILLEKLEEFPNELKVRNEIASTYSNALKEHYRVPSIANGFFSSWAQYTLCSDKREDLMSKLKANGIPSMIYYEKCMHQQKAFDSLKDINSNYPNAESFSKSVFSLPMHPYLSQVDIDLIINELLGN